MNNYLLVIQRTNSPTNETFDYYYFDNMEKVNRWISDIPYTTGLLSRRKRVVINDYGQIIAYMQIFTVTETEKQYVIWNINDDKEIEFAVGKEPTGSDTEIHCERWWV